MSEPKGMTELCREWLEAFPGRRARAAKRQWRDYYRSVRILRNIRSQNADRFKRFSQAWWRKSLRAEYEKQFPQDGRFGWEHVALKDRLKWFKLKKRAES